ncbi:polymerase [Pacific coast tick nairovirus]|uniref:RNA-directed RNA polymerase L n=1 Tax=Pacific coast tick nairovirus TaxID=1977074 RepID=A0A2R2WU07_9VIRU|nr:polymerase [Pacific coast tick nairovirus]ARF07704.1 polymerase [Pacific coast tick nairovirus]
MDLLDSIKERKNLSQALVPKCDDIGGSYRASITCNLTRCFESIDVTADGNCFFYSVILHSALGDLTVDLLKGIIKNYARHWWDTLIEAPRFYEDAEDYARELELDGYWGGSVEAEILNHAYGMPVLFWYSENWETSTAVQIWPRQHSRTPELNLVYNGSHFRYLRLVAAEIMPQAMPVPEEDGVEIVSDSDSEELENLEDIFLPEHEKERLELFSKPEQSKAKLDPKVHKDLLEILEQEKTLPIRVGRLLSRIFPCNVRAVRLESSVFQLVPEHDPSQQTMSLSDMGKCMMKLRTTRHLTPHFSVHISEELLAFSDSQFILTNIVGSSLLASNAAILPTEIVYKISTIATVTLVSTFLYKESMEMKRDFIFDCLEVNGITAKAAKDHIRSLKGLEIYKRPLEVAQSLVSLVLGATVERLSLKISRLPAASYLLLNCVDIQSKTLVEYEQLIDDMSTINEEQAISSTEVQDVSIACNRLEKVFEINRNGGSLLEYRDYLAREGLAPDKHIHGASNIYHKAKELVLNRFFHSRNIMKMVSRYGKAYSGSSITSLMSYISNLVLSREKLGLTTDDVAALEAIERRLMAIQSRDRRVPIPILCSLVESRMLELWHHLPEDCAQECQMLFSRVRNSETHSTAWSSALRLKGVAYEGLFAKARHIKYVPEDQKPTLSMAIQTYFPEKFELFLQRTQLHPEVREFRPDFLLAKRPFPSMGPKGESGSELTQLVQDTPDPDSVAVLKRKSRAFPLPSVPIDEPVSFKTIVPTLKTVAYSRLKKYGTESGKLMSTDETQEAAWSDLVTTAQSHHQLVEQRTRREAERARAEESTRSATPESDPTPSSEGEDEAPHIYPLPPLSILARREIDRYNHWVGKEVILIDELEMKLKRAEAEAMQEPKVDEEEEFSGYDKTELLVIEVGYQTDSEAKVQTDVNKWKIAISLMKDLGIRTTMFACSDCTSTKASDWFIPEASVKAIKDSVSNLFSKLAQNSPQEVTDMMVGAISTQKIRSVLKSGSAIRTPVTIQDILTAWNTNRHHIVCRPTGVQLPLKIENIMKVALCEGAVVTREGARAIIDEVLSQKEQIAGWVEQTKYAVECLEPVKSAEKLMLGWLLDDISYCRCEPCLGAVKSTLQSTTSIHEKLKYLCSQILPDSHRDCCHPTPVTRSILDRLTKRIPLLSVVRHMETEISDLEGRATALDRICRLTLPGKTEKERSVKRGVEALMRQSMKDSMIQCIKMPTGQIMVNTELFNSKRQRGLRHPPAGLAQEESRLEKLRKQLAPEKLTTYSSLVKKTIAELLRSTHLQAESLCVMKPEWVRRVLSDLDADATEAELLRRLEETRNDRLNFHRNNDKLIPFTPQEVKDYIEVKSRRLLNISNTNRPFKLDCLLHKELYLECVRRYQNTPYYDCINIIGELVKVFLQFDWFQDLTTYSKVCETFLQSCTEFNRSGVKIRRVRHTNLNLAISLPSNKKENMKCALYDTAFTLLGSSYFMMSRRIAVLGAALPYIVLICALQCLQHARCIEMVHDVTQETVSLILARNADILDSVQECLLHCLSGGFESGARTYVEFCQRAGNFLNKSSRDTFIVTVSGLSVMFSTLLGPSMILNSQPFNKQIQNMRFGMLYGLSRIASPQELGKKLSSSSRHIETFVSRLYMQLVCFASGLDPASNIQEWKQHDLCPNVSIPSFTIAGTIVTGDRQLIFDIYLVHIYNKEMDNFDEGCIKVLEETLERHVSWERDLLASVEAYKKGRESTRLKETRTMRLLLGLPNLKLTGESREESEENYGSGGSSSASSSYSIGKTRTFSSGSKFKSVYGRLRSTMKPISLSDGMEMVTDPMSDFRFVAQDTGTGIKYEPSKDSVMKDIKQVVRDNPSHTFGSFGLVQSMVEHARKKFPPEAISKAQRNVTNWQGVSAYTESTSSVAEPKDTIVIKDALKILSSGETKKTVKLIRNRLKKLDGGASQKPERLSEIADLISTVKTFSERQRAEIRKGISEPSRLAFFPWREIVNKPLRDVLITNDANMIYCWLKSLATAIKKAVRPYMPSLRYCKESRVTDHPKLSRLLNTDELKDLKSLMDTFGTLARGGNTDEAVLPTKESLHKLWLKFMLEVPFMEEVLKQGWQSIQLCLPAFGELTKSYRDLVAVKEKYPGLAFMSDEIKVKLLEADFIDKNGNNIMKIINMVFAMSLACPWAIHYKSFELLLSRENSPLTEENMTNQQIEVLRQLGPCTMILEGLHQTLEEDKFEGPEADLVEFLYRYCCALFTANDEPIKAVIDLRKEKITSHIEDNALSTTKSLLAKYGLERSDLDFKWTLNLIANSNFEVTKRITGRSEGERLPRSVRSKVIYEMIKLVKSTGMAILQQHAFSYILNSGHRFFSVLAPKAQLGGHRDLLVQEIMTKIIHAASETFSRSLLATTNDDGLTNQDLKESILQHAHDQMQISFHTHGKPVPGTEGTLIQFHMTVTISGDRTKWGPIHCTAFFSAMMQQLLQDVPDWNSFFKLVMLKNLYRQVEIPSGAIKKVLNAFRLHLGIKEDLDSMTEDQLRDLLSRNVGLWNANPFIQFMVQVYLAQGKMALECYNHMGQGIHHATSSVMTSCMAVLTEDLIASFFQVHMPELTVQVKHAGSSDDYAKVITLSGVVPKSVFETYENKVWHLVSRLQNAMIGVARACQMKDSAKTLIGDLFCEFYSEFMLFHRVTPAVIKFILTGLINSSVTSPQSMIQACQVSAQQAMYNSVSLLTNLSFSLFRQQIFANHTELFQRKYGPLVHGLPSAFGRLYLPMFSNLTSSAIAVEDAESLHQDLSSAVDLTDYLRQAAEPQYENLELPSPQVSETESNAPDKGSDTEGTGSVSSGSTSSFQFLESKGLTSTELEYLKMSNRCDSQLAEQEALTLVEKVYEGHSDFEGWPCLQKLAESELVTSTTELKTLLSSNPLRLLKYVRAVLASIIIGHYRSFSSEGTEKTMKANLNRDENRIVEDPMIQLVPEKLRRELSRLGLAREDYEEFCDFRHSDETLAERVARKVITMNCLTEDFEAEADRLKQALSSRNIVYSLAGGIKELSLPLYTIFLKSYFFIDKFFMDLQDRWNSRHSRNYRDSTGRSLEGRVVTKYMVWLDTVLSSHLARCSAKATEPPSLFNSSIRCAELQIHWSCEHDQCTKTSCPEASSTRTIVLKVEDIKTVANELRALSMQFSDTNRLKLKILESSRPSFEREANKVVISKSGLFSAGEQVKIRNNPPLVIGFLLSKETVLNVRPSKLDLSSLIIDTVKLEQFYTSISEVCAKIVNESVSLERMGESPSPEEVTQFANTLTLLGRLAQKSNSRIVSFHMIKPISTHTESTVSDLISYGTKEGRNLHLSDSAVETGTTSLKYWRILQCLAAIACLNLSDESKTSLLVGFMNWVPRTSALQEDCPMAKHETTVLEQFKDRSLVSSLFEELPNIKREAERKQIESLVDYIKDPMVLVAKKPFFGKTVDFNTRGGELPRNGSFTLSSATGEAVGTFISGSLHIHLSTDSELLLSDVEQYVLQWQNRLRTDIVTVEQHEYFLDLLPGYQTIPRRLAEGVLKGVEIDRSNPRMLRLGVCGPNSKVVKIRPHILTVRKSSTTSKLNEPRLVWGKTSLSIVYDEYVEEVTYHESILRIRERLEPALNLPKSSIAHAFYSDMKVVLGRVNFQHDATVTSLSLLHHYLVHSPYSARMEFHSKTALLDQVFGNERGDLAFLKQVRDASPRPGQPLKSALSKLLTVANNVEQVLNSDAVPLHCLSEVQNFLDETGNSSIRLEAELKGLQPNYNWRCSVDIRVGTSVGCGLRDIINTLGTESLPLQLSQFVADARLWHELQRLGKLAQSQLVESILPDDDIEALFCCAVYIGQLKKRVRDSFVYSPSTLLTLVRDGKHNLLNIAELSFAPTDDGQATIEASIQLPFIQAKDKQGAMKLLQTAMAVNNALTCRARTARELKQEAGFSVTSSGIYTVGKLYYDPTFSGETTIERLAQNIIGLDDEGVRKLKDVVNLGCFLMGTESPVGHFKDDQQSVLDGIGEGLTKSDIIELEETSPHEVIPDKDQTYEFDFS